MVTPDASNWNHQFPSLKRRDMESDVGTVFAVVVDNDNDDDGDCCASCDPESSSGSVSSTIDSATSVGSLRILTWSGAEAELRAYADLYHTSHPTGPTIHIHVVPSLKQLDVEATHDLRFKSGLYDGFVVPPLLLGNMYEQHNGLSIWDESTLREDSTFHDLLPYYKYSVATYDRAVRSIPLFGGSQQLLLFRKDYLDRLDLPTPKTWSDWVRIASKLHDAPFGPDGSKIYGGCLGRLSQEGCRQRVELSLSIDGTTTTWCNSQSMTYLGMMLSGMTQSGGNSTGWMMGLDATTPSGLLPLFVPTIERILLWMELQVRYGAPNELFEDANLNLRLFEQGLCGMTVTSDHPTSLLNQQNVAFVPLPGSHQVLDRSNEQLMDCSDSRCPHGVHFEDWDTVNVVPFGTTDAPLGTVSAFVSEDRQDAAKQFFSFIMAASTSSKVTTTTTATKTTREQPMTYSELNRTTIRGYEEILTSVSSSENGAIPFRVPNAFNLFSELDNKVYEYLVRGNYTDTNRENVALSVQTSWQYMIRMHDSQGQSNIATSIYYEKSLGTYGPNATTASTDGNLYIGDVSRIIGWSLGGLSCLASVILALWVWKYQNETVVRASQPMFLWMVCAGTLIMASSIFPFGIEDDIASYRGCSIACMSALWLFCLGFVATFSALFSKIWLINRIFREARNQQRIRVTGKDILLPFLMLFGVNFIVLLVWTVVDPQEWVRMPVDGSSNSSSSSNEDEATAGRCYSDNNGVYLGIILGTNFVMMMVALIQAYECRRITTEYSESFWISGSIACIAQIWIIGLPILPLVQGDPQAVFLTKAGVIFSSSISTLGLLFGPKFSYLRDSLESQQHGAGIKEAHQQKHHQQLGAEGSSEGGQSNHHHHHHHQRQQKQHQQFSDTDSNSDEDFDNRSWAKSLVVMPNSGPTGVDDDVVLIKGITKEGNGGGPHPSTSAGTTRKKRGNGPNALPSLGIRVIPTTGLNSNELDRIQIAVDRAESRNKQLQTSLEKLQERFELYVIARDPMGSNNIINNNNVTGPTDVVVPVTTADIGGSRTTVGPSYLVHHTSDHHRFAATGGAPHHWNNRVGRNSILAARPQHLSGPASLLDENSLPFQN